MTQEILKLALEALEELYNTNNYWWQEVDEQTLEKIKYSITAIKEALALQALHDENERLGLYKDAYVQPEQEPSGHFLDFAYSDSIAYVHVYDQFRKGQQFYKAPPQRTEQEPVGWMYQEYRDDDQFGWRDEIQFVQPPNDPNYFRNIVPVYTTPPQRTWVGLTLDQIALLHANYPNPQGFALALQAKLKEKNT
jgi:hypothetical protein